MVTVTVTVAVTDHREGICRRERICVVVADGLVVIVPLSEKSNHTFPDLHALLSQHRSLTCPVQRSVLVHLR